MADWLREFDASYRFMRVSRATGAEVSELEGFEDGGSISRNLDTDVYESASATCEGGLDVGADLVRVYLDADFGGEVERVALGTFVPSVPKRDVSSEVDRASVSMQGRLSELAEDAFDAPFSLPAGSNPVAEAAAICRACGLAVSADVSAYRLSTAWTFGLSQTSDGEGGSKLKAVNALLGIAGFASAVTDPMGTVLMRRYAEPDARPLAAEWREGADARFLDECVDERDASGVANVVRAVYETPEATVIGVAVDDDPGSPYSTAAIGRRRVKEYRYDDEVTQAEADAEAARLLAEQASVTRRVTVSHVYAPHVACYDAVTFAYRGIGGRFAVRAQDLTLGAGCMVRAELRRFERAAR